MSPALTSFTFFSARCHRRGFLKLTSQSLDPVYGCHVMPTYWWEVTMSQVKCSGGVDYYSKYFLLLVWFVCTADSSIKIQLSWTWLVCFYIVILSLVANSQPAEPASGRESCSLESIQQIHPPPSPCNANSVPAPASHIKQTTKWKDITEWGINDWDLVVSE